MSQLHYHPEGKIFIRTDRGTYEALPEDFMLDAGSPPPPLPEGITERIYDQGIRHALISGHDVVEGGPMPWPEGDAIIAAYPQLAAKAYVRTQAVQAKLRET